MYMTFAWYLHGIYKALDGTHKVLIHGIYIALTGTYYCITSHISPFSEHHILELFRVRLHSLCSLKPISPVYARNITSSDHRTHKVIVSRADPAVVLSTEYSFTHVWMLSHP